MNPPPSSGCFDDVVTVGSIGKSKRGINVGLGIGAASLREETGGVLPPPTGPVATSRRNPRAGECVLGSALEMLGFPTRYGAGA